MSGLKNLFLLLFASVFILLAYVFVTVSIPPSNVIPAGFTLQQPQTITYLNTAGRPYLSPLHTTKEQWLDELLDRYVEYHNNVTAGLLPQRYAACSVANGYGNVWQQFVSCALYAILSNRALVLEYRSWDMNNPFLKLFDDLFLPPPVKLLDYNKTHIEMLQRKNFGQFGSIEIFVMCFNMTEFANTWEVLGLSGQHGYDFFGNLLRQNPYHELMHKLPTNFYQIIFRKFLRLQPGLQAEVDKFKAAHFGKYNIAVQMRVHDTNPNPQIPLDVLLQAAELLSAQTAYPENETVIFIATQNSTAAFEAMRKYGEHKIAYYEGPQDRASKEGKFVGLITMWLMGECDDVVTSEWSSFGTNAASRTGIIPVVCTHMRYCFRRLTPTPCTSYPYPVREACPGPDHTINRYGGIESHCMFMEIYARNCIRYGCPNPYNSWPNGWMGKGIPNYPPECVLKERNESFSERNQSYIPGQMF